MDLHTKKIIAACSLTICIISSRATVQAKCLRGNCIDGYGTIIYNDPKLVKGKYTGYFKNGKRHGQGTFFYNDGSVFTVQWKDNIADGYGTFKSFYGITYIGVWKNLYINGHGTIVYPNGEKYQGYLLKGKRHGKGVLYNRSGAIIENGIWKDDIFRK